MAYKWANGYTIHKFFIVLPEMPYAESVSLSFQFSFLISNFYALALNFNQINEKEILQKSGNGKNCWPNYAFSFVLFDMLQKSYWMYIVIFIAAHVQFLRIEIHPAIHRSKYIRKNIKKKGESQDSPVALFLHTSHKIESESCFCSFEKL